jgi:hypothetical protein
MGFWLGIPIRRKETSGMAVEKKERLHERRIKFYIWRMFIRLKATIREEEQETWHRIGPSSVSASGRDSVTKSRSTSFGLFTVITVSKRGWIARG